MPLLSNYRTKTKKIARQAYRNRRNFYVLLNSFVSLRSVTNAFLYVYLIKILRDKCHGVSPLISPVSRLDAPSQFRIY